MKSSKQTYAFFITIILVLAGWILFFNYISPEELVQKIGIKNVYLASFILSVVGGFSSITGTSVYAAITAIAHSGVVNPLVLGVISGLGIFLSDSLFYFIARYGHETIVRTTEHWKRIFGKIRRWVRFAPDWLLYTGVLLYSAFSPLPNDIILAVLAVSGHSYRQFAPFLFVGDLTLMFLLTQFADRLA